MGVSQTVYTELRTKYATISGIPSTEYPNEPFTKPSPAVIWARFNITEGEENQLDIGNETKSFRTYGVVTIQLFAPQDNGAVSVLSKADTIADSMRNWCGTTVRCNEASVRNIGNDGFGWYQVNVTIPFRTDYIR